MENNFLSFIEEDIEAKKTLLSVMPVKTKKDVKAYNQKVELFIRKYENYRTSVRNYITTKSRSFNVKCESKEKLREKLTDRLNSLELTKFVLNPLNTFFEKMGFDNLLYEINNYNEFNFNFLNSILNEFVSKFELAEIELKPDDFDYTCYVNEYMTAFLELRNSKTDNYESISPIFERIYWENPNLIVHIKLNFRKLIYNNIKKFNKYIERIEKEVMKTNGIIDYDDCLIKLEKAYRDVYDADKENIAEIIDKAMNGELDVSQLLEGSKSRETAYTDFLGDLEKIKDDKYMSKVYEDMEKLKCNIEEYRNFLKFSPMLSEFRKEYEKSLNEAPDYGVREEEAMLRDIRTKEKELAKYNHKLLKEMNRSSDKTTRNLDKQILMNSACKADQIEEIYKKSDSQHFKKKIVHLLTDSLTIEQALHICYSFDYYKKLALKRVFKLTQYEDIISYSDDFDLFAMNPMNVIVKGILVFKDIEVSQIIMNKYRIDGITISGDDLSEGNLDNLIDKINLLLRINIINNSKITAEKIHFMVEVNRLMKLEKNDV